MFNKQNFCHVASNNRNEKKAGVFVYKTTDDLATVSVSGYFNEKIVDINLHDLIIHEWHDATDRTKVQKNVLCVTERTLDNVGTVVIKSKWEEDTDQAIADLQEYVDNTFVRKDGTSVMTGPLLMRATDDFKCAIAPYWDGVGFFKLNDNNSVTLMASLEYESAFEPAEANIYDIGTLQKKWNNLYLAGSVFTGALNNGVSLTVPTPASADTLAVLSDIAFKSSDVEITSPANGQFLMYNGTKWINTTQGYANTDLSNLTATGEAKFTAKANDNAVVHLAGTETITGSKTFDDFTATNGFRVYHTDVTKGTSPASAKYWNISINDKTNSTSWQSTRLGALEWQLNTSGTVSASLQAYKNAADSTTNATLKVAYDTSTDRAYATAPASDIANSIVTTVSNSKSGNGYVKLGNGIIIQWGKVTTTGDSRSIVLPTAFGGADTWRMTVTPIDSNSGTLYNVSINNRTSTGCDLLTGGNVSNVGLTWIAIGY